MNLYHWNSKLLANYSSGDIIVMAEYEKLLKDVAHLAEALEQIIEAAPSRGLLWHGSVA